jgi:hypothetical protein
MKAQTVLSWGYWFGSRTQGLLIHPYVTMREIVREHFLRPLAVLPVVMWIMSWVAAVVIGRIGLWLDFAGLWWTVPLGKVLVFLWMWFTVFLVLWQMVLGYLYVRFWLVQK